MSEVKSYRLMQGADGAIYIEEYRNTAYDENDDEWDHPWSNNLEKLLLEKKALLEQRACEELFKSLTVSKQ